MSLEDYYNHEKHAHTRLRENICKRLSISRETFYIRLRRNRWSTIEQEAIADLLSMEVKSLFPDTVKS